MKTLLFDLAIIVGIVAAKSNKKSETKYIPAISTGLSDGFAGLIVWNLTSMLKSQTAFSTLSSD